MNEKIVIETLRALLDEATSDSFKITKLQRYVDSIIIEDMLPKDVSVEFRNFIDELQVELELIAVNQTEHLGTRNQLSKPEIAKKLQKYAIALAKFG